MQTQGPIAKGRMFVWDEGTAGSNSSVLKVSPLHTALAELC